MVATPLRITLNKMDRQSKIYVAGHRGLVGSAIVNNLKNKGYNNLLLRTHDELDLTDQHATKDFFIKEKLKLFGDYEDAVNQSNNILFHSTLSPYINLGLITPDFIISKTLEFHKKNKI